MPNHYCCVLTCKMTKRNAGNNVRFIKFPIDPKLLEKWRSVIGRGPDFPISQSTRICSNHFVSGRRSLNPSSEDYVPSIFPPSEYRKRTLCRGCRKMSCICDNAECNATQTIGEASGNPAENNSFSETTAGLNEASGQHDADEIKVHHSDTNTSNEIEETPLKRRKVGNASQAAAILAPRFSATISPTSKPDNSFVATKVVRRDVEADLQTRIKELELDHSRKLELMSKNHTMTIANLKEEFQQKIHTLKCEWDEEKQKLWAEIGYMKDLLTRRPFY